MDARVLTVTADPDFGKSLQFTLEVEGGWPTKLVGSLEDALADTQLAPIQVVLFDAGQFNGLLRQRVRDLQTALPEAAVVVILPEDLPDLPGLFGLGIDDYLIRPFYSKDLLSVVKEALAENQPVSELQAPSASVGLPESLSEHASPCNPLSTQQLEAGGTSLVDRFQPSGLATQWLAAALQGVPVASAMIFGRGQLWHMVSNLPEKSQAELGVRVAQLAAAVTCPRVGVVRYAQYPVSGQSLSLYGLYLEPELFLGLAFAEPNSFAQSRQVAASVVSSLRAASLGLAQGGDTRAVVRTGVVPGVIPRVSHDWEAEEEQVNPVFVLDDVPPPTPEAMRSGMPEARPLVWSWQAELEGDAGLEGPGLPGEIPASRPERQGWETGPATPLEPEAWLPEYQDGQPPARAEPAGWQVEQTADEASNQALYGETDVEAKASWGAAEGLQQANVAYDLSVACILVTRLPAHQLNAALAERLERWMTQLAMAFGWRLTHLSITDHAMHWLAALNPEMPASHIISMVRRHTSQRIFAEFPHLGLENPSGDYWAPGYFVKSAFNPLPEEIVREYVGVVRRRQGAGWQEP